MSNTSSTTKADKEIVAWANERVVNYKNNNNNIIIIIAVICNYFLLCIIIID